MLKSSSGQDLDAGVKLLSYTGLTKEISSAALTASGLAASTSEADAALASFAAKSTLVGGMTNIFSKLEEKISGVKSTLSGIGAVMSAHPVALAVTAIGLVTAGIVAYTKAASAAALKKATETATEGAEKYSSAKEQLESYVSEIKEYREVLDSSSSSAEEIYNAKVNLLGIQESLISSYGDEAEGIDLVNGKLDDQIAKLNSLSVADANSYLNRSQEGIDIATEAMEKNYSDEIGMSFGVHANDELLQLVADKYSDYIAANEHNGIITLTYEIEGAENADRILNDFATDVRSLQDEFGNDTVLEQLSNDLEGQLEFFDGILEKYQDIYSKALDAQALTDSRYYGTDKDTRQVSEWLSDYSAAVSEYNTALAEGDSRSIEKAQTNLSTMQGMLDELLTDENGLGKYKALFYEIAEAIDTASAAEYNFEQAVYGNDLDTAADKHVSKYSQRLKDADLSDADFIDQVVNRTNAAAVGIANEAVLAGIIADTTVESLETLAELLANWGVIAKSETTKDADPLSTLLEQLQEDDGELNAYIDNFQTRASELSEALSKFNLGNLSDSDIIDLYQKYPELLNYDSLGEGLERELTLSASDTLYYILGQINDLESNGEDAAAWRELYDYVLSTRNSALQEADGTITQIENTISDLQTKADKASESLSLKEVLGRAVTEDDYQDQIKINEQLISQYTKEINELKALQGQATTTEQYRDYQESIDAAESSIVSLKEANVELAESIAALPVDRISNEIEDLQTEADLIQEQIDLETEKGKMIDEEDYSKLIENSKEQVKYLEQQNVLYEKQLKGLDENSDKYREIHSNIVSNNAAIREAIASQEEWNEKVGINSRAYFDAYEAATSTTNQGSNYDTMQSALENMQEAYKSGLIGTDDFKAFISYLTPYGTTDSKSTEQAMKLAERYLTEDATGLNNFINDMVSAGLGTITNGIFEHTFTDIESAAKQMNIGEDFFLDMWDKSKEYGGYADFFSNTEDGLDVLDDLYGELADKTKQYYDVLNNGGDTDTLSALASEIDSLNERTRQATESLNGLYSAGDAEDDVNTAYASIGSLYQEYINTLNNDNLTDQARKDIANRLATLIEETASEYSIELPVEWKTEGLGASLQAEVNKFDVSDVIRDSVLSGIEAAGGTDAFATSFADQLATLSQYTAEELGSINLNDGQYDEGLEEAERAIDAIQTGLGTSYENASSLLQVLVSLGLLQIDGIETSDIVDVNADDVTGNVASALEVAQGYANENPVEVSVTSSDAISGVEPTAVEDTTGTYVTVTADTTDYTTAIEAAKEEAESTPTVIPVNADLSSFTSSVDSARSTEENTTTYIPIKVKAQELLDSIDTALDKKTFSVKVRMQVDSSGGNTTTGSKISDRIDGNRVSEAHGTPFIRSGRFNNGIIGRIGSAYAKGSVGESKDTTALTGELGQELVVRGNRFFTVGDNGAEFVNLKKDDIVFNHAQTQQLLSKGYTNSRGKALVQGNARDLGTGGIPVANGVGKAVTAAATSASDAVSFAASSVTSDSSSVAEETSTAIDSFKDWISSLVDWIEVRLDYLANKTEKYLAKAERRVDMGNYSGASTYYKRAMSTTNQQITANTKGAKRYQKQANSVMSKAIADGLVDSATAADIKKKVAKGTIDIQEYDENVREVISSYQTWYEKFKECSNAVAELYDQYDEYATALYNLPVDKATAKIEKLSNSMTVLEARVDNVLSADRNRKYAKSMASLLNQEIKNVQKQYAANATAQATTSNNLASVKKSLRKTLSSKEYSQVVSKIKNGEQIDYTTIKGLSQKDIEVIIRYNAALEANDTATQTLEESTQETISSVREYSDQIAALPWDVAETKVNSLSSALDLLSKKLDTATKYSTKASLVEQEIANVRKQDTQYANALKQSEKNVNSSATAALRSQRKAIKSSSYSVNKDGTLKANKNASKADKKRISVYNANLKASNNSQSMSTNGIDKSSQAYKDVMAYNSNLNAYRTNIKEFDSAHQDYINNVVGYYETLRNLPIEECTEKVNLLSDAMTLLNKKIDVTKGTYQRQEIYEDQLDNLAESYGIQKNAKNAANKRYSKVAASIDGMTDSALKGLSKDVRQSIVTAVKAGEELDIEELQTQAKKSGVALTQKQIEKLADYNAARTASINMTQTAEEAKYDTMSEIQEIAESIANLPTERMENKLEDINNARDLLEAQYDISDNASVKNSNITNQNTQARKSDQMYQTRLAESTSYLQQTEDALASLGVSFIEGVEKSTGGYAVDSEQYQAIVKYNEALEARKTAENEAAISTANTTKTIRDNAKTMFDNVAEDFENAQNVISAALSKLEAIADFYSAVGFDGTSDVQVQYTREQIAKNQETLQSQQQELSALRNAYSQNAAQMSTADRLAAETEIINLEASIAQTNTSIENLQNNLDNLKLTKLQNALDVIDAIQSDLESQVSLKQAYGQDLSEQDYFSQMEKNTEKYNNYLQQRTEAYSKYTQAVANGGAIDGQSADEWYKQYLDLDTKMNEVLEANETLKDSLRDDVYWRDFERAHDAITRLRDNLSGLNDLIRDEMKWDSNGKITDLGWASLALDIKDYEQSRKEVQNYTNDIANLQKLYAQGYYTSEEYKEKLAELQKSLLDAASDMMSLQDTVIDFYQQTGQKQLDALFEIIDARKEDLDAQKEAYDWYKTVRSNNKELQDLDAQIAAYENLGDSINDASKAKLAQLKAERQELKDEIDDSVQEHVFELTSEGLSDLEDALQEAFDDSIEEISGDITEIIELMDTANELTQANTQASVSAFNKLLKYYGIDPIATGVTAGTGFATGGIVRSANGSLRANGDNTIVRVNPGETILTQKFTKLMPEAVDVMSGFINNIGSMPSVTPIQSESTVNNDYSITVQGNVDAEVWPGMQKTIEAAYKYNQQQNLKNAKAIGVKKKFG